jgi:HEAT repeat protein
VKRVLPLFFALACCFAQQQPRSIREMARQGDDSIPKITPYLNAPDLATRLEAVKALIEIGGPKTIDALIKATKDNDAEMQIRAAEGLVNTYYPGYMKFGVSGSLQRAGDAVRAKFGGSNDQVIDSFVLVRADVISALDRLVGGAASYEARAVAARGLGVLRGRAALDSLIEALRSKDDQLMYECLVAIRKIGDVSAGPRIAFRLRDLDDRVQLAALETTGILRTTESAPEVADVFDHARTTKIKHAAAQTLAQIGRPADRALFVVWLKDRDESLRIAGAEGLGRLKQIGDTAELNQALKDEKGAARLAVVFALISVGNVDDALNSPLSYMVSSLKTRSDRSTALAYLKELARDLPVRQGVYKLVPRVSKDEKVGLCGVLEASGEKDSIPILEMLSMDPDADVASEGVRALRAVRARLP